MSDSDVERKLVGGELSAKAQVNAAKAGPASNALLLMSALRSCDWPHM
jgi:hypothetical protein